MYRTAGFAICALVFQTGCSGAGAIAGLAPLAAAPAAVPESASVASDATFKNARGPSLYVADAASNAITVYGYLDRGNVAPARTIAGPETGITCLEQIAVDRRGYLYVANLTSAPAAGGTCSLGGGGEILVFAPGATGDAAPVRTIGGPATGIANATSVAVADDGTVYAGSIRLASGYALESTLVRFAPGASGNVAPVASATLAATQALDGIALDPNAGLITSSQPGSPSFVSAQIGYYNADLTPAAAGISFDDPGAVAIDPATRTYVGVGNATYGAKIDRYADGTTGAYAGPGGKPVLSPGIVSSLAVATCPSAVAIGPARTLYVAGTCPNSVSAYAPDASGTAAALRVIQGPLTQLAGPKSVVVGP